MPDTTATRAIVSACGNKLMRLKQEREKGFATDKQVNEARKALHKALDDWFAPSEEETKAAAKKDRDSKKPFWQKLKRL